MISPFVLRLVLKCCAEDLVACNYTDIFMSVHEIDLHSNCVQTPYLQKRSAMWICMCGSLNRLAVILNLTERALKVVSRSQMRFLCCSLCSAYRYQQDFALLSFMYGRLWSLINCSSPNQAYHLFYHTVAW